MAWAGIYYGTISLLELPGIVLSGWITGQPYLDCIYQSILYDYIYLMILSIILIIIFLNYGCLFRRYISSVITKKNSVWWIIFAISEWWVITYFLYVGSLETGRDVFVYNIVSILCILCLAFGFACFIVFKQSENERQQRVLQNARMETEYLKIKDEYQKKAREIHDLKHHLQALGGLLTINQNDSAQKYLKSMLDDLTISQERSRAWTGNPFIDSLLNGKKMSAKQLGVELEIYSSNIVSKLSDKDMSVLLGNLIDNAIEASSKAIQTKSVIIQIINKSDMLFIHVKNTIDCLPCMNEGKLVTTKEDKINHGWGMKSIESIVEKYGGQMDINFNQRYFEINITFWGNNEVKSDETRNEND